MNIRFTDSELAAYLDEALPPDEMARIEQQLRGDAQLLARLAGLNAARDSGAHLLGEIWRRRRLTCPSRAQLGSYLLEVLPADEAQYVAFHIDSVGCRICQANLEDLRSHSVEQPSTAAARRERYFQSSAGYLRQNV